MLTIEPEPAVSTMARAASWLIRNGVVTLNRSAVSKNRSEVCIAARGPVPPALLTRTSRRPNRSTAAATSRSRSSASITSVTTASPRRPVSSIRATTSSRSVGRPGADHDVGAGLGQADRDAATDALPAAGDDRDPAVEAEAVEDHRPRPTCGAARPAISGRSR